MARLRSSWSSRGDSSDASPPPLPAWQRPCPSGRASLPAMGQVLPIEMIMPPARPVAAQGFGRSAAQLPTAFFHRGATPTSQPSRPVIPRPANAEQVLAVTAPLPPSRPAGGRDPG